MEHTFETHLKHVDGLCRICGRRTFTKKQKLSKTKPRCCCDLNEDILFIYHIDISKDIGGVHSRAVCVSCVGYMGMAKRCKKQSYLKTALKKAHENQHIWLPFDETVEAKECPQCQQFMYFSSSNKFLKKKNLCVRQDQVSCQLPYKTSSTHNHQHHKGHT